MLVYAIRLWTLNTPQNSTRDKQKCCISGQTTVVLAHFNLMYSSNEQTEGFLIAVRHITQILSITLCLKMLLYHCSMKMF